MIYVSKHIPGPTLKLLEQRMFGHRENNFYGGEGGGGGGLVTKNRQNL